MKSYKSLSGIMAACILGATGVASVSAQQVFEGNSAVAPAYAGQTRAPLAPRSTGYVVSDFVTGLHRPWAMAHMPNGNMLVTEVPGRLRIVGADGSVSDPIKGVPALRPFGSRGLNDVILDPDFENNRMIYFAYHAMPDGMESDNSDDAYKKSMADMAEWNKLSREEKGANPFGVWRVSSARLSKDGKSIDRVKTIIDTTPSRMAFDEDGKLLLTTQRKSPMGHQDLTGTAGMILRLNKDGSVPNDNPFVGVEGVNPMAYVTGLRNSNSLALNPTTNEFWAADQAGDAGDEVNVIEAGKDYGWPEVSYGRMGGTKPIGTGLTVKEGTEQPIYYWSPVAMAPSSMTFYHGDNFPDWKGNLFLTGLSSMHLSRLVLSGDNVIGEERLLDEPGHRLRHVSQGNDGNIYVIQDMPMTKILKITPKE
ncbi:MAG: PQQ-dependent sugar dehydrogenase [Kordiimonadaceae bacterium]|jgi:aldose sugar dehydrogenase|nr:PQQ-dependent sugar dehydrogenase [Kordiimonadaceae bacterium]MBT6032090.1 PQQ-dependent sugar dehydrogenase [Kordiimonadaceae bacterium]